MPMNVLRNLPSVNELLDSPQLKGVIDKVNRNVVVARVRTMLDDLRHEVQHAATDLNLPSVRELAERFAQHILAEEIPPLRPVVNATGVLLPNGLGRAPLADAAIAEMAAVARDYANLELNLATAEQSSRSASVESLLVELTGAEAALVVNNNAAGTLLALAAIAGESGREVLASRGEMIDFGDGFRLPDVLAASGAVLKEVGTTNTTRLADYEAAITGASAALLLVHASNYSVIGAREQVSLEQLTALGRARRLPVIHDIGSGALWDMTPLGLAEEPIVGNSVRAGADLVLFSGDKLVGGPQCGILVGRRNLIAKIGQHPLARAVRVDKLTLAALGATLRLHRKPPEAQRLIPLLHLLATSLENLKLRAQHLAPQLAATPAIASAEAVASTTYLCGIEVPNQQLSTWCMALRPVLGDATMLATELRAGNPAIVARVERDQLLLDLRSVFPRQDQNLVAALEAIAAPKS